MTKTVRIPASVPELHQLSTLLEESLDAAMCPMKTAMQIQLAAEELFVNIASYAYESGNGDAEITVSVDPELRRTVITFVDSGTPFNPLLKKDADVTLSAEDRGIGGLGIYLVKKNMDNVDYTYQDGKNIVTITKQW